MADKLVTIAQFSDYIEANLAKQLLADFGIKSVVTGENTANVYSVPAIAEIDLQVLDSQAQQAQEILESHKKKE
jgi:ribosomal protein S15P/S13E